MGGFNNKNTASEAGKKSTRKGQKNEKTEEWEKFRDLVLNELTSDVIKIVGKMTDEQKVEFYITILKYFKPAMASQTIQVEKPEIKSVEFIVKK